VIPAPKIEMTAQYVSSQLRKESPNAVNNKCILLITV
jgi:hypothetical protein